MEEVINKPMVQSRGREEILKAAREIREREPFNRDSLSPLGHYFMGSTPKVHGKTLDVLFLINKAEQGSRESLDQALTPIRIQQEGKAALPAVQRARAAERENRTLHGLLPIFEHTPQLELAEKEIDLYVEPNVIDSTTCHEGRQWRVFLLDEKGNEVEGSSNWKGLDIIDKIKRWFSLEELQNENYHLLKLHLQKPSKS